MRPRNLIVMFCFAALALASVAGSCDVSTANVKLTDLDQTLWGARVKRLKVGTARRFSRTTQESLVADLRTILAPHYVARAREFATRMSKSADRVAAAADLLEDFARLRRVG